MKSIIYSKTNTFKHYLTPILGLKKQIIGVIVAFFMFIATPSVWAEVYIFSGTGNWSTTANWSPSIPPTNSVGDVILITCGSTCTLTGGINQVLGQKTSLIIESSSKFTLAVGNSILASAGSKVTNFGTIEIMGDITVDALDNNKGILKPFATGNLVFTGISTLNGTVDLDGGGGPITVASGAVLTLNTDLSFGIDTRFLVETNATLIANSSINNIAGSSLFHNKGHYIHYGPFQNNVDIDGLQFFNEGVIDSYGPVLLNGFGLFNNSGVWNIHSGVTGYFNCYTNNTGTITIDGNIAQTGSYTNNGTYKGSGAFTGTFQNTASGIVSVGNSAGCHSFNTGFSNAGKIFMEIGGTTACTQHDRINVTQTATLGGTLEIALINGFRPSAGQVFTLLKADAISGTFSTVILPTGVTASVNYTATEVQLVVSAVLPVNLIDFSGQNTEGGNLLHWKTAEEKNTSHFDIERSPNGQFFTKINEEKTKGTNSIYQFLDVQPLIGVNYYRLKINDFDGKLDYSKTISLSNSTKNQMKIYSNPVIDFITIENVEGEKIEIVNALGQVVQTLHTQGIRDAKMKVHVAHLPNGFYVAKTEKQAIQFIKN